MPLFQGGAIRYSNLGKEEHESIGLIILTTQALYTNEATGEPCPT